MKIAPIILPGLRKSWLLEACSTLDFQVAFHIIVIQYINMYVCFTKIEYLTLL